MLRGHSAYRALASAKVLEHARLSRPQPLGSAREGETCGRELPERAHRRYELSHRRSVLQGLDCHFTAQDRGPHSLHARKRKEAVLATSNGAIKRLSRSRERCTIVERTAVVSLKSAA